MILSDISGVQYVIDCPFVIPHCPVALQGHLLHRIMLSGITADHDVAPPCVTYVLHWPGIAKNTLRGMVVQ